jgi:tetratricopeptide (TPR) repeat protein
MRTSIAALALGFNRHRRYDWRDEYHFALAVYGLMKAKWDSELRATECALISAGVAAARVTQAQQEVRTQMHQRGGGAAGYPSYRVPLFLARQCWLQGKAADGAALLQQQHALFPHAVPLEQEYALLLAELGAWREARAMLLQFREGCRVFGDYETLSRLGRAHKNAGDRAWHRGYTSGQAGVALAPDSPAWRQYQLALEVYEEAFVLSEHCYPGVNAASLAVLLGDRVKAERLARRVAVLSAEPVAFTRDEPFWVHASRGEAALVLGRYDDAHEFYGNALPEITDEVQYVQTAYHQLCRLWHVLDQERVGRLVDEVFGRHPTWAQVQAGPVGGCGGRK